MTIAYTSGFLQRCINDTLAGLREGLTRFSGKSRSALIFSPTDADEIMICDPQSLLRGHEPILQNIYLDNQDWRGTCCLKSKKKMFELIESENSLPLDGLISYGGKSYAVYYQMWFTEHHPDICSTGPTERWLEHASQRFTHDITKKSDLYTGISGSFLREYATHAVHDYIIDQVNLHLGIDTIIQIYPLLEAILDISKTPEEGARPLGELIFVEPRLLESVSFVARFRSDQQPHLDHSKHVRKLLQSVEQSPQRLVSDGKHIIGIADHRLPEFCLIADFQRKLGFLRLNDELVCSFQDGSYKSTTHRAKLYEVEEMLLDYDLDTATRDNLFQIVSALVHNAENKMFGCTLVIDLGDEPTSISGQELTPPINLQFTDQLQLAYGLSKVDGALHITKDLHLRGFACLLDGQSMSNEDRARGARYNSALRFTAVRPDTIVVVVSSDRPVSIIQQGEDFSKRQDLSYANQCALAPEPLREWIKAGQ